MIVTKNTKDKLQIIVTTILIIGIIAVIIVSQRYSRHLSTRGPEEPETKEALIEGNIADTNLAPGEHTLTLEVKTDTGQVVSISTTFTIEDITPPLSPSPFISTY